MNLGGNYTITVHTPDFHEISWGSANLGDMIRGDEGYFSFHQEENTEFADWVEADICAYILDLNEPNYVRRNPRPLRLHHIVLGTQ